MSTFANIIGFAVVTILVAIGAKTVANTVSDWHEDSKAFNRQSQ